MSSYFAQYFKFLFIFSIFIIIVYISLCFSQSKINVNNISQSDNIIESEYGFVWPIPGYTNISSYFGKRISPTSGASTFHLGIDIPAVEGSFIYSIDDAKVIFASWGAGGGYTITLKLLNYDNIIVSYCHVSPLMYVKYGDIIDKNKIIGCVGPKNVYGIVNNPYKDSNGNPTNGATTGCHLHFAIKLNNKNVNPLDFYSIDYR